MKISVTFRNTDESEGWQRDYVEEKLKKLKKYIDDPVDARVVLSVEKFRNTAEINLSSNGLSVNSKEEEKDMHMAIDNAVEKIERQLKKHKERFRDLKTNAARGGGDDFEAVREDGEDAGDVKVVETRKMALKPMSIEDAVLEMETTKNHFLVYRDSLTENVNVIYRLENGKFSLLETSR